ncbi:hypothetical protein T03_12229 [Trichinella britovi]|uniref:Uncharacterized protein n=1 Tax=Trichinella britovi TaxID=45882 RepID=A0A0V1AJH6_TRIBR|nr:hypothetical protein T03_12229 [Trichinella britovi]
MNTAQMIPNTVNFTLPFYCQYSGISRFMLGIGVCCVQTPLAAFSPDQHR